MLPQELINNTDCPFLREIYYAGWEQVINISGVPNGPGTVNLDDILSDEIILKKFTPIYREKRISREEFTKVAIGLKIKGGTSWLDRHLPESQQRVYKWIADADGSANRFRELIK